MKGPPTYSRSTRESLSLLGSQVRLARTQRRMTVAELAERVGVSPVTIRKVERGDPTVALGTALEAATIVGIPLHGGPDDRAAERGRVGALLTTLPERVRRAKVDDRF